jgi:hypothetical protein
MNMDFSDIAKIPFEEHPIILSEVELSRFEELKTADPSSCNHKWVGRSGRPDGDFLIVHDDFVERRELPRGRYCSACHRVELEGEGRYGVWNEGSTEDINPKPVWTQKDFIALGFL